MFVCKESRGMKLSFSNNNIGNMQNNNCLQSTTMTAQTAAILLICKTTYFFLNE